MTVEGRLLLCLGNEHSMDLRAILRDGAKDFGDLKAAIVAAMDLKPERHYFYEKDHAPAGAADEHDRWVGRMAAETSLNLAVVTVSDTRTAETDTSGALLAEKLQD